MQREPTFVGAEIERREFETQRPAVVLVGITTAILDRVAEALERRLDSIRFRFADGGSSPYDLLCVDIDDGAPCRLPLWRAIARPDLRSEADRDCSSKILSGLSMLHPRSPIEGGEERGCEQESEGESRGRPLGPEELRAGAVFVCDAPFIFLKWVVALDYRQVYLNGLTTHDFAVYGYLGIANTVAEQDVLHYGEIPFTLRHVVRGGQARTVKERELVEVEERAKEREILRTAWSAVQKVLEFGDSYGGTKVNHTDLQFHQAPDDAPEFLCQLVQEYDFPRKVRESAGYLQVEGEVRKLWGASGSASVIMWVRNVSQKSWSYSGNSNRKVAGYELAGCLLAAKLIAADRKKQALSSRVIILGDDGGVVLQRSDRRGSSSKNRKTGGEKEAPGDEVEAWATSGEISEVATFLGSHMRDEAGQRRNHLQQLQFLTALVRVTGAVLVVGERTGAVDKIALCGSIACCQFVGKDVHQNNERHSAGYAAGCAMGCMVQLSSDQTNPEQVSAVIRSAALKALRQREQLRRALLALGLIREET